MVSFGFPKWPRKGRLTFFCGRALEDVPRPTNVLDPRAPTAFGVNSTGLGGHLSCFLRGRLRRGLNDNSINLEQKFSGCPFTPSSVCRAGAAQHAAHGASLPRPGARARSARRFGSWCLDPKGLPGVSFFLTPENGSTPFFVGDPVL